MLVKLCRLLLATLSHLPRTEAAVKFTVDPVITVQKCMGIVLLQEED